MWLMLSDCFLSIVHKNCRSDELLVRARRKGDIEKVFPVAKVTRSTNSDYLYRAVIKRAYVEAAVARETTRITYSNFKDSVPKDEQKLHDAYLRVWSTMADLQPTRPYSGGVGSLLDFGADPQPKKKGKKR